MALNIKNQEVERLLDQVVQATGESKTEAVRRALSDRLQQISLQTTTARNETNLWRFMRDEIWAHIPPELVGTTLTREEEDALLGYGEDGV